MAIDEAIARLRGETGVDTVRVYMWKPTGITLGRRQDAGDVDLEEASRRGYIVVRRPTGGGALLHREDWEVTYSVVLSSSHRLYELDVASSAAEIARGVALAVERLGAEAGVGGFRGLGESGLCYVRRGSSDVVVRGVKVSGSAQRRAWGALLQHGTLLLDLDPDEWLSVVRVEGEARRVFEERVGGLRRVIGWVDPVDAMAVLAESLVEVLGYRGYYMGGLSREEMSLAMKLYRLKYSRPEWNLEGRDVEATLPP